MSMKNKGKDLTKEAPRSPHEKIGGFVIIARAIDKCRAELWGKAGEYRFDCPLDNYLFSFKGLKGADVKKFVETGASDGEIVEWVKKNGMPKTEAEIAEWSKTIAVNNYSSEPDSKSWLEGENRRLGLQKDGTLFDMLDADDATCFKGGSNVCL
ncbi:MAG: hypothetical protein UX89_C0003G0054 [Parcubacteria group bacterium GW2011_GWA2_47_16]|nr:MAG: hypothetical protein UX89_C0003G0054 [Parcubacteria group bacterium GW2011_GWA2_47_16]